MASQWQPLTIADAVPIYLVVQTYRPELRRWETWSQGDRVPIYSEVTGQWPSATAALNNYVDGLKWRDAHRQPHERPPHTPYHTSYVWAWGQWPGNPAAWRLMHSDRNW